MTSNDNSPIIQSFTLSDIVYNWIRDAIQEHLEVISALERRDEAETERVIAEHMKRVVAALSVPD